MEALIELDPESNFLINLKRFTDTGFMSLSTFKIPMDALEQMIGQAMENNDRNIPTMYNSIQDENDFFDTLEIRGLNSNIKVSLISNLDGFYFEIGNDTLKAGIIYGPIRYKVLAKIIELDWPVEVYLPIYSENEEEEDEESFDEQKAKSEFKRMTPEQQRDLLKMLEEQEKRGEI